MKPTLSIVIVNYNTKKLTLDCIDSVVKSKPKVSFEIIIIDNGSSDDSFGQFKKLVAGHWPLTIIENKENLGFAEAVNQGIKAAKGGYVLLLNSDTKVKRGTIDKLVDFAGETPDVGVVGAKLLNADGSIQPSCYNFPSIKNAVLDSWFGKKLLDKFAPKENSPVVVDSIVGAAFLITPKALKEVGPLNERYFMFFEDMDYCRRVKCASLKVYYLPAAEVIHFHGQSGKDIASWDNQWRRLIPSSKIYHGLIKYYIIYLVMWAGQKWQKLTSIGHCEL
jgi:GT2 family glycosyltransferase